MALLLTFYGDDFSGSTDAMEVLALAGVPTRLYLDPPTAADLPPGLLYVQLAIRASGFDAPLYVIGTVE